VVVATILINEPHHDVRALLVQMASRLGYHPVSVHDVDAAPDDARVLVFEPAEPECLEHAETMRLERPDLKLVCVSIRPPEPAWLALGPISYVTKPFTLDALRSALAAATVV
jgi:CheY-like chemotaxis protein